MGFIKDFPVTITGQETVVAASPLPELLLPLSNLDLAMIPVDICVFGCYKKPAESSNHHDLTSMADALKASLAQLLVKYYALSGEVVANPAGEPELLCSDRGVDFVEAYADVDLTELMLYELDDIIRRGMLPVRREGVLAVQVTGLRCGGIVVACRFDHRIADGYSGHMFLTSWAECARSSFISIVPSFRRSLLNPRHPCRFSASVADRYTPMSSQPSPENGLDHHLTDHLFYIKAGAIDKLQALASSVERKMTKFEAFSAYVWQALSRCAGPGTRTCRLSIPVDGRARLSRSLMDAYFGNVISVSFSTVGIEEMKAMELDEVAAVVRASLQVVNSKEHYEEVIDFVESCRPTLMMPKTLLKGEDELVLMVSSGLRFMQSEMDFGWGEPVVGSVCLPWDMEYIMPMPSVRENGDWVVCTRILKEHFPAFEAATGDVLRPMTSDYLGLTGGKKI